MAPAERASPSQNEKLGWGTTHSVCFGQRIVSRTHGTSHRYSEEDHCPQDYCLRGFRTDSGRFAEVAEPDGEPAVILDEALCPIGEEASSDQQ